MNSTRSLGPALILGVMFSLVARASSGAPGEAPSPSAPSLAQRSIARADVASLSGGGSVVVGTLSIAGEPRQAWIAELDEKGEVVRERAFAGTHGSASFTKVALLPSGGCVVGLSLEEGAAESPVFRAGLVWLGADLLPTQSAELGLGCAAASIAALVPLMSEGGAAFALRVEVDTCAASGFAEIQRVDSDGFVAWRHRIVRGLGGAALGASDVAALPGGQVAVTLRPRSGGKASRVLLDADGVLTRDPRCEGPCEDSPAAAIFSAPLGGFPTRPLVLELRLRWDRAAWGLLYSETTALSAK